MEYRDAMNNLRIDNLLYADTVAVTTRQWLPFGVNQLPAIIWVTRGQPYGHYTRQYCKPCKAPNDCCHVFLQGWTYLIVTLFALHMYYNDASTKFLKDLVGSNVGLPALYFINDDATSVFENVDKSQLTRTLDKQKFALGHHIVKDKRMLADLCYPPAEDVEDHTCVLYSNKFLADVVEDTHENEDEIKASSLQVKAFIKFAKKAVLQTLFPNRRYAIVPSFKLLDVAFPKPTRSVETSSKNAASTEMDDHMVAIVKYKESVYYRYDGS